MSTLEAQYNSALLTGTNAQIRTIEQAMADEATSKAREAARSKAQAALHAQLDAEAKLDSGNRAKEAGIDRAELIKFKLALFESRCAGLVMLANEISALTATMEEHFRLAKHYGVIVPSFRYAKHDVMGAFTAIKVASNISERGYINHG